VGRFIAQPRLRLAWSIACARSVYWSSLFIYGPIMLIESGLSKTESGYLISASQIILPLALVSGYVARVWACARSLPRPLRDQRSSGRRPLWGQCPRLSRSFSC
jgi:hypothetical protein